MQVETTVEKKSDTDFFVYVKNLPSFVELKEKVDDIIRKSTWFEKYGYDWFIVALAVSITIFGYYLSTYDSWSSILLGAFLVGLSHGTLSNKSPHLAAHGAVCESPTWNNFWCWLFAEVCGFVSYRLGTDIHIKMHHPYTNIIGLGDSSTWKLPMLPGYVHMFISPLFLPVLSPLVSVHYLFFKPLALFWFLLSASFGLFIYLAPLVYFCGHTWLQALCFVFASRTVLSIAYLHVNIFQHIGLPMYSKEDRPSRLYQMCSGVLNLDRIALLDYTFGHSLISCHVEHHLFPKLSDNMCLKVKPIVKAFIKEHGLPYHEDSYQNRLKYFLHNYNELMVNAPSIIHYVGLQ